MGSFFWGVFVGGLLTWASGLIPLSYEGLTSENQRDLIVGIQICLVGLFLLMALGLWIGAGSGSFQYVPPTPTPLLGR